MRDINLHKNIDMNLKSLSLAGYALFGFYRHRIAFLTAILRGPLPHRTPTIRRLDIAGIELSDYTTGAEIRGDLMHFRPILPFVTSLSLPSIFNSRERVKEPLHELLLYPISPYHSSDAPPLPMLKFTFRSHSHLF